MRGKTRTPHGVLGRAITAVSLVASSLGAYSIVMNGFPHAQVVRRDRIVSAAVDYSATGYVRGATSPAHTLLVFSDFQCPFCRAFARVTDIIEREHPEVRIVERHLPLSGIHPLSVTAALAAECARDLGRYSEMRNVLFANQKSLPAISWGVIAQKAGIDDTLEIVQCIRTERHRNSIEADLVAADQLGIASTPSVFLDSLLLDPPPTLGQLDSLLLARGRR